MRLVLLAPALLLSACSGSGFWRYERDSFTLPGANPNRPVGSAENFQRAQHKPVAEPAPMLTEAGDIWPPPSTPVPTLKDLQKQQTAEINGASNPGGSAALAPLPPLPSLPGYEISPQDVGNPAPPLIYPGSVVPTPHGRVPIGADQGYKPPVGAGANGNIIVPNGNGTSTVISPTGQVTTIPTPK
jgi:hypothetical protein